VHNDGGSPQFINVVITGNTADHSGGGVRNVYGYPIFTNVTISNNSTSGFGGGVYNKRYSPTFTNSIISGNAAFRGGGVYNFSFGYARFTNVAIRGNTARADGGGVYNSNNTSTFTNVTISGNTTTETYGEGGGIYNDSGDTTFHNSIIWNNQDNSGTGTAAASAAINSGSLTFSYSLVQGQNPTGTGNLNGTLASNDPLFVSPVSPANAPTTSGDYRLNTGSPAIDVGNNSLVPAEITTDLDGVQRIANGIVNLGAYETVMSSNTLPGDCNADGTVTSADTSALVMRLFDPTQHNNPGCDANSDGIVSAADMSAIVILLNGGTLSPAAATEGATLATLTAPALTVGAAQRASDGTVALPILLDSGDHAISSLFFAMDYDERGYALDPTDHDGDGIPDALRLDLPDGFEATVRVNADDTAGELDILLADVGYPLTAMPDGTLGTLTLDTVDTPTDATTAARISSSPAASFGSTEGAEIPGRVLEASPSTGEPGTLYLPLIVR
jgi:hypothetical protein